MSRIYTVINLDDHETTPENAHRLANLVESREIRHVSIIHYRGHMRCHGNGVGA